MVRHIPVDSEDDDDNNDRDGASTPPLVMATPAAAAAVSSSSAAAFSSSLWQMNPSVRRREHCSYCRGPLYRMELEGQHPYGYCHNEHRECPHRIVYSAEGKRNGLPTRDFDHGICCKKRCYHEDPFHKSTCGFFCKIDGTSQRDTKLVDILTGKLSSLLTRPGEPEPSAENSRDTLLLLYSRLDKYHISMRQFTCVLAKFMICTIIKKFNSWCAWLENGEPIEPWLSRRIVTFLTYLRDKRIRKKRKDADKAARDKQEQAASSESTVPSATVSHVPSVAPILPPMPSVIPSLLLRAASASSQTIAATPTSGSQQDRDSATPSSSQQQATQPYLLSTQLLATQPYALSSTQRRLAPISMKSPSSSQVKLEPITVDEDDFNSRHPASSSAVAASSAVPSIFLATAPSPIIKKRKRIHEYEEEEGKHQYNDRHERDLAAASHVTTRDWEPAESLHRPRSFLTSTTSPSSHPFRPAGSFTTKPWMTLMTQLQSAVDNILDSPHSLDHKDSKSIGKCMGNAVNEIYRNHDRFQTHHDAASAVQKHFQAFTNGGSALRKFSKQLQSKFREIYFSHFSQQLPELETETIDLSQEEKKQPTNTKVKRESRDDEDDDGDEKMNVSDEDGDNESSASEDGSAASSEPATPSPPRKKRKSSRNSSSHSSYTSSSSSPSTPPRKSSSAKKSLKQSPRTTRSAEKLKNSKQKAVIEEESDDDDFIASDDEEIGMTLDEPEPTKIDSEEFEVERILGIVPVDGERRYLIKWKGYPHDENSIEPRSSLAGCKEMLDLFLAKEGIEPRKR